MVRKAKHKEIGTIWTAWQNDTGECIRSLDGCSGPYWIPADGWEVNYFKKDEKGQWSETHGLTPAEFAERFELLPEEGASHA